LVKKAVKPPWAAVAAVLFVYCLLNGGTVAENSGKYLRLCAERVVPALFVFSVLANIICKSKAFYTLCRVFPRFGVEAALLAMGMLGGFPLGAAVAVELYDNGAVDKRQAEYLCAFTNNPSLSFTVSYVGGVFNSKAIGIRLALLTALSAVAAAIILKPFLLPKSKGGIRLMPAATDTPTLSAAIKDTCTTMLVICGCIVFFGSICWILPQNLQGFLELSGGISNCRSVVNAAVLLGFSGVSVLCQIAAVCKGKLSAAPYLTAKLIQGVIMGAAAHFLL